MFKRATKTQSRLRLALIGPSGSGKTYTAIKIGTELGGKIAVIDTERGSASKYADEFSFDAAELASFDPRYYTAAIKEADAAGYDVLIIDSLSHAWAGVGGALELVDKAKARSQSGNSFTAWKDVTPLHNQLVDTILQSRCHVIVTMRAKTEYVMEADARGKQTPRKVGLAPIQRDGMEYEFDIVADVDLDHRFIVSKTRCKALDAGVIQNAEGVAETLRAWLSDGAPAPEPSQGKATYSPEREQMIAALRTAYKEAWNAGAEVATPTATEIAAWTDDQVRQAITDFRAAKLRAEQAEPEQEPVL